MKRNILILSFLLTVAADVFAQQTINLPQPSRKQNMTLMQALQQRHSAREFSSKQVSEQQLADLLWAACGINRREEGKLTAPSAMNKQDVKVYVCREDGAWFYQPSDNSLTKVTDNDIRYIMERGGMKPNAPITLVLVSNKKDFEMIDRDFCDLDCGYVSQNISLACTAMGLATRPRAGMDRQKIKDELHLADSYDVIINHPIGYEKK